MELDSHRERIQMRTGIGTLKAAKVPSLKSSFKVSLYQYEPSNRSMISEKSKTVIVTRANPTEPHNLGIGF